LNISQHLASPENKRREAKTIYSQRFNIHGTNPSVEGVFMCAISNPNCAPKEDVAMDPKACGCTWISKLLAQGDHMQVAAR
jgi:hypothetical protein